MTKQEKTPLPLLNIYEDENTLLNTLCPCCLQYLEYKQARKNDNKCPYCNQPIKNGSE
jgi:uncharacterized CHY-type Zn-finger protein